jgi:hypothetical protein
MKERIDRYVVEVRDTNNTSLLSTAVDWTDGQRNFALKIIMRLLNALSVIGKRASIPDNRNDQHQGECPVCGHIVDKGELDGVMAHLEAEQPPRRSRKPFWPDSGRP